MFIIRKRAETLIEVCHKTIILAAFNIKTEKKALSLLQYLSDAENKHLKLAIWLPYFGTTIRKFVEKKNTFIIDFAIFFTKIAALSQIGNHYTSLLRRCIVTKVCLKYDECNEEILSTKPAK